MAIKFRTSLPDPALEQIGAALKAYAAAHPQAEIELYRQNNVSVRVRIIDPDFAGKGRRDRHREVSAFFDELPEEVEADVTMLVLLTPEEKERSLANFEFDHPTPSRI